MTVLQRFGTTIRSSKIHLHRGRGALDSDPSNKLQRPMAMTVIQWNDEAKFHRLPDIACLTRKECAAVLGISERTLITLEAEGLAPRRTQLSQRRYGYTVAE